MPRPRVELLALRNDWLHYRNFGLRCLLEAVGDQIRRVLLTLNKLMVVL